MSDARPLVGIDVGSSTVSVLVAAPEDDRQVVLGFGQARHDGARKGVIANLDEVSDAVRAAAEEAEAMSNVPVERAVVGLGGTSIHGVAARASVPVTGRDHTVTREDERRALLACAKMSIPPDYRVLDVIPCGYAIDGQDGVDHPVGMPGARLDASAFVLYTHKTHADTVEQAVNRASVEVVELVHEPLAAAESALSRDERDLGCLLLDIGYGSSEWMLFADGAVVATGASGVSGRLFTADLATLLKTTTAAAERTKRQVGAVPGREGLDMQAIEVPSLGGAGQQVHSAAFAAEILYERSRDLLVRVHRSLVAEGLDRLPRAGVVLTGGGALLEGLEELAEEIFGYRVRVGTPRSIAGLTDPVSGPDWTVACGLVQIQHRRRVNAPAIYETKSGIFARLRSALGEFFELGGGT